MSFLTARLRLRSYVQSIGRAKCDMRMMTIPQSDFEQAEHCPLMYSAIPVMNTRNMIPLLVVWCIWTVSLVHTSDLIVRDKDDDSGASSKPTKALKMFNFASQSAGAVIIDKSPATAKGYHYLLNDDKDKYGISACEEKKWVVIGLSEDILITSVELSNYEKYSSMLKDFQLLASNSYPTDEWINLGKYTARPQLGSQTFNVTDLSASHTRYLKVKFQTHYSDEALCTLSQIKVYGMTVIASFQQEVQRSDHHTRDVLNHLTAEEDVNFREIMENSLREEALHVEQHHEPQSAAAAIPMPEPADHSSSSTGDQVCPDTSHECTADSCPTLDASVKETVKAVSEPVPVVEKYVEGVYATEGITEKVDVAVPTADPSLVNLNTTTLRAEVAADDKEEISYTVSVDGGGMWVEPQRVVENEPSAPLDAPHLPTESLTQTSAKDDIASTNPVDATQHVTTEAETVQTETPEDSVESVVVVETEATPSQEKTPPQTLEEVNTSTNNTQVNTCTNSEVEENTAAGESNPEGSSVQPLRPFAEKVLKQLLEFNLFTSQETAEVTEDTRNCTEPAEEYASKNGTVLINGASANTTRHAHHNATKTSNETSHAYLHTHGGANETHVISNVSTFVSNASVTEKSHQRAESGAVHFPLIGTLTANVSAQGNATNQEKSMTKANTTHGEVRVDALVARAGGSHNVTANTSADTHTSVHKPAELNFTHDRAALTSNKTENSTVHTTVPIKTSNSSSSTNTTTNNSTHNSTGSSGSALNCFETLSFAKFSEKMRLKLQQKSGAVGGGANGSHTGSDSAVVAEAAALAAAAGASAKDNNVFRSLMQKIKTLEVDNAIVEMYTIQLSDCYKTVTKELLSRTQIASDNTKKFKFGAETLVHGSLAHTVGELEELGRLAPQILFNYTEAKKLGIVDTFLVVLLQVVEENLVGIVLATVVTLFLLVMTLFAAAFVLLVTKRARPRRMRDEH